MMDNKDCAFCGHDIHREGGNRDCDCNRGEWKRCHEEEKCFNQEFECREKKIIECRKKHNRC